MERDCFVVMSTTEGLFWDGAGWVPKWQEAQQFAAPPLADPWLACHTLCLALTERTGVGCVPAFFPRPEVRVLKRQGRRLRPAQP
jgi:hypothetical protein